MSKTMKEHPIIFSTEMVKAILEGRKTMTRRIIKPQPDDGGLHNDTDFPRSLDSDLKGWNGTVDETGESKEFKCPYGVEGDSLWVRETFSTVGLDRTKTPAVYKASVADPDKFIGWKPSIHMPRKLSRITLKIESIGVERLQAISVKDIQAEGVRYRVKPVEGKPGMVTPLFRCSDNSAMDFLPKQRPYTPDQLMYAHWAELWCDINGRESWDANPWVWKIKFNYKRKLRV